MQNYWISELRHTQAQHSMTLTRAVYVTLVTTCAALLVQGHGRLLQPPSRASMWRIGYDTPKDYMDNQLFCGGFTNQWDTHGGKCGVCGDPWQGPRDHEAGGKYATGLIPKHFPSGATFEAVVELTASHWGWFEFRLCPNNNVKRPVTQACLDRYLLRLDGEKSTRYPVLHNRPGRHSVMLKLPRGLHCVQCVLQWKYHAGNSWGNSPEGQGCVGCGNQEEFYGCADIAVGDATKVTYEVISATTLPNPTGNRRPQSKELFQYPEEYYYDYDPEYYETLRLIKEMGLPYSDVEYSEYQDEANRANTELETTDTNRNNATFSKNMTNTAEVTTEGANLKTLGSINEDSTPNQTPNQTNITEHSSRSNGVRNSNTTHTIATEEDPTADTQNTTLLQEDEMQTSESHPIAKELSSTSDITMVKADQADIEYDQYMLDYEDTLGYDDDYDDNPNVDFGDDMHDEYDMYTQNYDAHIQDNNPDGYVYNTYDHESAYYDNTRPRDYDVNNYNGHVSNYDAHIQYDDHPGLQPRYDTHKQTDSQKPAGRIVQLYKRLFHRIARFPGLVQALKARKRGSAELGNREGSINRFRDLESKLHSLRGDRELSGRGGHGFSENNLIPEPQPSTTSSTTTTTTTTTTPTTTTTFAPKVWTAVKVPSYLMTFTEEKGETKSTKDSASDLMSLMYGGKP